MACSQDDADRAEDRPMKRVKTHDEQEFIQGTSIIPEDGPILHQDVQHDDDNPFEVRPKADYVPLHTTDSVSLKDAARVSGYAAHKSNGHAERLMQDADFRAAHTSAAGADFIDGFYKNSRLHHLSAWKVELRALVAEAQERADKAFALGDKDRDVEGARDGGEGGLID